MKKQIHRRILCICFLYIYLYFTISFNGDFDLYRKYLFLDIGRKDVCYLGDGDICAWVNFVDQLFHFSDLKTV